jgi:hypothetical protein
MERIIRNAIVTPDGTLLVSRHTHDYVGHTDKNGEYYFTDGGTDYIRRSANVTREMERDVYSDDCHTIVREYLEWGTYGRSGSGPLKHVRLKDMDLDHILAILATQGQISNEIRQAFRNEIKYRIDNE